MKYSISAESYFDGEDYHCNGPYSIVVEDDRIARIGKLEQVPPGGTLLPFVMPGLTEAHCHLFLKGEELDFSRRSEYLKSSFEEKMKTGRENLNKNTAYGVTCLCDAGDNYGVNVHLQKNSFPGISIRQAEKGIRKKGRYGSFLARPGDSAEEFEEAVRTVASKGDVLKIVLTGIIDFESGQVKGEPQFSMEELKFLVGLSELYGLKTMTHCSGVEGLEMAVEAGVGSIEHGFFMNDTILSKMRDKNIAWVPTFIPVQFQLNNPRYAGWNDKSISGLEKILEEHRKFLLKAEARGNVIFTGSDAGSYGVEHGVSFMEELRLNYEAGVSLSNLLNWATIAPRKFWQMEDHSIKAGKRADIIVLEGNPFKDFRYLLAKKEVTIQQRV